jgi:hypothetical protein
VLLEQGARRAFGSEELAVDLFRRARVEDQQSVRGLGSCVEDVIGVRNLGHHREVPLFEVVRVAFEAPEGAVHGVILPERSAAARPAPT